MSKRHQHLSLVAVSADNIFEENQGRGRGRARKFEKAVQQHQVAAKSEKEKSFIRPVKIIHAKTDGQAEVMKAIDKNDLIIILGMAGTGKTHIAIAKAVEALRSGRVKKIVLSRPAVEAGERLGFMPGDINEKMDPYMRPLFDELLLWVSPDQMKSWMEENILEIVPIAFMRGRTLRNAAIVLDEAQNATRKQLKMVVTRLGEGSFMIITGDPNDQSDLKQDESGLANLASIVDGNANGASVVRLGLSDVVRHPVVKALLPFFDAA